MGAAISTTFTVRKTDKVANEIANELANELANKIDFDEVFHEDDQVGEDDFTSADRDSWSHRDWPFPFQGIGILTSRCSLRQNVPPHFTPPNRGASVATATAMAIAYECFQPSGVSFRPSATCIQECMKEIGNANDFRSAFRAVKQFGVCSERAYESQAPDDEEEYYYADNENYSLNYYSLDSNDIKKAICLGFPVVGMLQVAPTSEISHAIVIIGFDDDSETYEFVQNTRDDGGYGLLAYADAEKTLHSLWMLRSTELRQSWFD